MNRSEYERHRGHGNRETRSLYKDPVAEAILYWPEATVPYVIAADMREHKTNIIWDANKFHIVNITCYNNY